MMKDPIEKPTVLQPKIWNKKLMFPHYMFHSKQLNDFSQEFYKWWKTYYDCATSPIYDVNPLTGGGTYMSHFFVFENTATID